MLSRTGTAALIACLTLVAPAAARAATKTVYAGPQLKRPAGLKRAEPNIFYPRAIEVHQGDKVAFTYKGFHNISYAPPGTSHPILLAPDTPTTGINDAAGAPFWFNGRPRYQFNTLVAFFQGNSIADNSGFINSGMPFTAPPPPPWKVTFPKTGKFAFHCDVHPGMQMTVTVRPKSAKIPSAAQDKRRANAELKADYVLARKLKAFKGPSGNVVRIGNDDRKGMATVSFFRSKKQIKVGQSVRFEMTKGTGEEHTVTFGPADYLTPIEQITAETPQGGQIKIPLDARLFYPSDRLPLPDYDGTNHGNGFFNTGVLDGDDGGLVPRTATIRFTKAGSYTYICLLHTYMKGTIVVS